MNHICGEFMDKNKFVLVSFKEFSPEATQEKDYKITENIIICKLQKEFLAQLEEDSQTKNAISGNEIEENINSTNYFLKYFYEDKLNKISHEIAIIFLSIRIFKYICNFGKFMFLINLDKPNRIIESIIPKQAYIYKAHDVPYNNIYPEDLKKIREIYIKIKEAYSKSPNPLTSALVFLEKAHLTYDFVEKYILLTTFLETLFNFDSNEVCFKISLRIAKFLNNNDQQKIFDEINKIYNHRSKFVHGKTTVPLEMKPKKRIIKIDKINQSLLQLNNYSIEITRKIFKEEEWFQLYIAKKSDNLEKKFNELILG